MKSEMLSKPIVDNEFLKVMEQPITANPQVSILIELVEIVDLDDEYEFDYYLENCSEPPAFPLIAGVFFPVGKRHGIHRIESHEWERALLADTFCWFWTENQCEMRPPGYGNVHLLLYSDTDKTVPGFAVPQSRFGLSFSPVQVPLPAMKQFDHADLYDRNHVVLDGDGGVL